MKVYLINPPSDFLLDDKSNMPLGLLYVYSHLTANGKDVDVQLLDFAGLERWDWEIPTDGDLYGITATTPQFQAAKIIAAGIKVFKGKTVLGGVHATCATEKCLLSNLFDIVVRGEGEHTFYDIVHGVKKENIDGISYIKDRTIVHNKARAFEKDIDHFHAPLVHHMNHKSYNCGVFTTEDGHSVRGAQIITARGCPHNCAFCCSPYIYDRKVRYHTPGYIRSQVEYLNSLGYNNFYIVDDTILLKMSRLKQLCQIFVDHGSRWRACVRGDAVTKEKMQLLYDSGCRQVDIGVESGSQKVLDLVQKGEKVEDNARAIQIAHEVGIKVKSCVIVGLPGEEQEDVDMTAEFIETNQPDSVTLCTFIPFPGCAIARNPEEYNYKVNYKLDYDKYVCCGADALAHSVSSEDEAIMRHRQQLLDVIQNRSTNKVLRERAT